MNRKIVGITLLVVTVLGVLGIIISTGMTSLGIIRISSIQTSAMEPTIAEGSLALSLRVPTSTIKPGDIISVRTIDGNNEDTLGRVEKIDSINKTSVYSYTLKSDDNPLPDEWLYKTNTDTYQLVFSTPVLGTITQFFKHPSIAAMFVLIIGILAYIYVMRMHAPQSFASRVDKVDRKERIRREEEEKFGGVDELTTWFTEKEKKKRSFKK